MSNELAIMVRDLVLVHCWLAGWLAGRQGSMQLLTASPCLWTKDNKNCRTDSSGEEVPGLVDGSCMLLDEYGCQLLLWSAREEVEEKKKVFLEIASKTGDILLFDWLQHGNDDVSSSFLCTRKRGNEKRAGGWSCSLFPYGYFPFEVYCQVKAKIYVISICNHGVRLILPSYGDFTQCSRLH